MGVREPRGIAVMSIEHQTTYEWTIDISWKTAAASLPLLFQLWIWSPFISRRMLIGSSVSLVAVAYMVQFFWKSTLRISPEGISSSGLARYRIPWENVRTVRLTKFFGPFLPQLQLVLDQPVTLYWVRKKTNLVNVSVPSVPSLELYGIILRSVGEGRIDPRLKEFASSPISREKLQSLLVLQIPLALCWLLFIFRNRYLVLPAALEYGAWIAGTVFLLSAMRQLMSACLRWYEPESLLREVRHVFATGSVHIVVPIVLDFRSDLPFVVSTYLFLWLFVSLEAFGLLQILRYFTKRISPYWGFLALAGFLFFPGQDLAWEARHVQAVAVASREMVSEPARVRNIPQHVVWPDGKVAVFSPLPAPDRAQLSFFTKDLEPLSTVEIPDGFMASRRGDWLLWAYRDEEKRRGYYYQRFGTGEKCRSLTAFSLIPSLRNAPASDSVFGHYGDTAAEATVLSVDLSTGQRRELFKVSDFLQAVQTGGDTLLWAKRTDTGVTISEWSVAEGNHVVRQISGTNGRGNRVAVLSPDFSHVSFSSKPGEGDGSTIIRIEDGKEWQVPMSLLDNFGVEWSPPYVAGGSGRGRALRVFRLHENGLYEEILSTGSRRLTLGRVTFSPDNRCMILGQDRGLTGLKHIVHDLRTGERRQLLLQQAFAFWNFRPAQTQWCVDSFYYVSHGMFLSRSTLVKVRVGEI